MGLEEYHAKRRFNETPEPTGGEGSGPLRFVIQKHDATALHYDFRLEMGGAMPSWAVPKGPSLNPEDKRLAMKTEDHPLDYRFFEGVIPKDNYGAGPVMIWDEGTYEPLHATGDREQDDKLARAGVHAGHLTFIIHGQKINGEFALIKMQHADEENAWLLVKAHKDEFVSKDDLTKLNRSVVTGRTLDEIAGHKPITQLHFPELTDAPKGTIPADPKPMLATLADEPFDDPNWIYEIKWDGYRILSQLGPRGPRLITRGAQDYTAKFTPVADGLSTFQIPALIDGEVAVVDDQGKPSFQDLQNYLRTGSGHLLYCMFDLVHLDGHNLTTLPLLRRKQLLQRVLGLIHGPHHQYSQHVTAEGVNLFENVRKQGLEGLIAKRSDSPYQPGHRSRDWLKLKTHRRQEAIIIGWTEPRGGRQHFGALVLGIYTEHGQLRYAGHTGSGFDDASLEDIHNLLRPLETPKSPIHPEPKTNEPGHWVQPKLVAEVEFTEWTADGSMRHPIFVGLRDDKPATEVRAEQATSVDAAVNEANKGATKHTTGGAKSIASSAADAGSKSDPNKESGKRSSVNEMQSTTQKANTSHPPANEAQLTEQTANEANLRLNRHTVHVTHLGKIYWPDTGYTKRDLIEYYHSIAPVILPYLADRPESMHRYPGGITGENFYHKDLENHPDWVKTAKIHSDSEDKDINFLVCSNEATLIYMANLGCIEINPWNSRIQKPEHPDWCVIDLDPEAIGFDAVIETAQTVHDVLDELGVPSYPKTSGATGIHIYIPMGAKYDYDQVRMFAQLIANLVHARVPKITSIERSPAKRQGKIYLDYLQNRHGQTLAAAYSVRPRPGAPVSTPLAWSEVKPGLDPAQFTIHTIHERLNRDAELWTPVLGPGINLKTILNQLESNK